MTLARNLLNAGNWNDAVEHLRDNTPIAVSGGKLATVDRGSSLSFDNPPKWAHPWQTCASWNGGTGQWQAKVIKAGFVNGQDPQIPGVNVTDEKGMQVTATVTDFPWIPIFDWRVPGTISDDTIPGFFLPLGVSVKSQSGLADNPDGGFTEVDLEQDPNAPPPRSLLAADLYIAQARPAYQGSAEAVDAVGLSGQQVVYSVKYNTQTLDLYGAVPRLQQAPLMPQNLTPSLEDRLLGNYTDPGEDYMLIATIYMLSPENVSGSEPDHTWTSYIQHNCFWNLAYGIKNIPPPKTQAIPMLFTGLAGGFGDTLINSMIAQINEDSSIILNAVNAASTAGIFWTI